MLEEIAAAAAAASQEWLATRTWLVLYKGALRHPGLRGNPI